MLIFRCFLTFHSLQHSILSITNDSYPLLKVIFIFYLYELVNLQIYLQHIYSQFFLWTHCIVFLLSVAKNEYISKQTILFIIKGIITNTCDKEMNKAK